MLNQNFTFKEFSYLVKREDYHTYFKSNDKDKRQELKNKMLQKLERELKLGIYTFHTIKQTIIKHKTAYTLEKINDNPNNIFQRLSDDFVLRKANKNIRRVYGVVQADRFKIIKNVKNLLEEDLPFYICKTDIKQFYESIDRNRILSEIKDSSILSFDTKSVIERLFEYPIIRQISGLPRGINVSSTLSEYFMRRFDRELRKINGFFFYARYVDDIIIFSTQKITKSTIKQISKLLPTGLCLNMNKTTFEKFEKGTKIQFLGYQFEKDSVGKLKITIAPKKIKKIKERIIKAFLSYKKDKDIKLLKDRLLFLSANYPLKTSRQEISKYEKAGYLHGGIAYNYPLINDFSCLYELDTFLYQILFTNSFQKISNCLNAAQKMELKKYSFYTGCQRRIIRRFKQERIIKIIQCWE